MRYLKYLLSDATTHKAILHQFDVIGAFLQANVKNRFFVRLDCRYGEYFPEYGNYFERPSSLILESYLLLYWTCVLSPRGGGRCTLSPLVSLNGSLKF